MDQSTLMEQFLEQQQTLKAVRRVFVITLGLNLVVALGKLFLGNMTHTLSLTADGFHSLLDAASNVVGIIALNFSLQPADPEHPYGHRKFEALASMLISFFIFATCFEIAGKAIPHLLQPASVMPHISMMSVLGVLLGLVINLYVNWYETREAKRLKNELLLADAKHTLSDVYVTISVLASMLASWMGWHWVDPFIALLIAVVILRAGYAIIMRHLGSLVDEAVLNPEEVCQVVMKIPEVRGCHKVRSRGMADHVFLDLHIQVDPQMSVKEAHQISYRVEAALIAAYQGVLSDVLVHIEEDETSETSGAHGNQK